MLAFMFELQFVYDNICGNDRIGNKIPKVVIFVALNEFWMFGRPQILVLPVSLLIPIPIGTCTQQELK